MVKFVKYVWVMSVKCPLSGTALLVEAFLSAVEELAAGVLEAHREYWPW